MPLAWKGLATAVLLSSSPLSLRAILVAEIPGPLRKLRLRSPQAVNPKAEMPAFAEYDDATIAALRAYFATFAEADADGKKP